MMTEEQTTLPWMPIYWDKFLSGTTHFDGAEIGAYMLLIAHQWKNGHIPTDIMLLKKIARVPASKLKHVLEKFEEVETGKMVNKICETIKNEQLDKYSTQSERGKRGAEKRWKKDASSIQQASAKHSPSMVSANAEERSKKKEVTKVTIHQQQHAHEEFGERLLKSDLDKENIEFQIKKSVAPEDIKTFNAHLHTERKEHMHYSQYISHLRNWLNTKPKDFPKEKISGKKETTGKAAQVIDLVERTKQLAHEQRIGNGTE